MKHEVKVRKEKRPVEPDWGCLEVNGVHIWRFDDVNQAELAKTNLERALNKQLAPYEDGEK